MRWLLAHALLIAVDDFTVVLPREVAMQVRGGRAFGAVELDPPTSQSTKHKQADVDGSAAGQAFTVVRLVEALLERWGVEPPGVLRAGGLGVRELRRTARELELDERGAALLIEVAHAAGLIAPDGETADSWLPTTGYDLWLAKSIADRWLILVSAWLVTTRVPGLVGRREAPFILAGREEVERQQPAANALGGDLDRALAPVVRREVLEILLRASAGEAPTAESINESLRWSWPRRGGRLRDDLASWTLEEAELLGLTGRGALSSFARPLCAGLYADTDAEMAAAGADPAAEATALLDVLLPKPLDHVLLQADLTAVAPGPLESDLARELAMTADIESTGGATVFRFSDTSIRRALDAGRSAADLHALLAARSRTPVPQPLSYLIDDVARRHGRIRIGLAGSYVRCDDDGLLNEVLADRRVESLRLRRLAPSVLVSPLAPERVAERLREVGYAPAAESPDGALLLRRPDAGRAPARPRPLRRRPELAAPAASVVSVAVKAIRGGDRAVTSSRGLVVGGAISDVVPHSASSETLAVLAGCGDGRSCCLDRLPQRAGPGEQPDHRAATALRWVPHRVRLPTRRTADVRGAPHHRSRRTDRWRDRRQRRRVDTWDNGSVTDGPLIVQSDKTLLLEVEHELAGECRRAIAPFAELERSPEHVHTYRLTPLGLWNARAAGHDAEEVVDALLKYSRYAVPHALLIDVAETMARYGRLQLTNDPAHGLVLRSVDRAVLEEVLRSPKVAPMIGVRLDDDAVVIHPSERGHLKQVLLKLGWPAEDLAGYVDGEAHAIALHEDGWAIRPYQLEAVEGFWHGGSGVVVLPCGAGKTIVGAAAMARAQATTLILVTNTVAARQWRHELLKRTSLTEDEIGEYSGAKKEIRPVTIATYQVMTTRRKGVYAHLELFDERDWGLIIYDEVHLLPAPIFRFTADIQSRRRLGLTATLVREDGREGDVFSLIGPKRYDAPWKDIEAQGYIAPADCVEVRVTLTEHERLLYATAEPEERYRLAATTETKMKVIEALAARHVGDQLLVIGQYLDQLDELGERLGVPVIKGETTVKERERLYDAFRTGEITTLVVSKVANFSIDLPEASVAIQVSGSFGSRQEEAQRLGRLLRPKHDGRTARFYAVVARDTIDQDYAAHRQRFLAEQGYAYRIIDADDVLAGDEI